MLYLAEVQKQKGGLLGGGGKTELKLLACQRADQSWSTVTGEDVVAAEEASRLNDGALVLVELTPNRQLQRLQEAGRPLVNILQNFSRQLEKFKLKEEEIDQWKQSLTFQAQELNRREMDLEVRLEQVQQVEQDFERLEGQRQEVETTREDIERLREEIERNRRELEGAWEHLRGEQRRLEEYKTEFQQGTVLDEQQSRALSELLDRLSNGVSPTEGVREELNLAFEMVERQQSILTPYWQQLEQQRATANQQQAEFERLAQTHSNRQSEWQQAQNSLEQAKTELKAQTVALNSKQEYSQMLGLQLRNQEELNQLIYRVVETSANFKIGQKVDVEALEKMPIEELQKIVQNLQLDLEKCYSFVNDQEEELKYQEQTMAELQGKLSQVGDHDRINIETELAEEQDRYQMLNETLVGQRRNVREREEFLKQHQLILVRRQGGSAPTNGQDEQKIDIGPVLTQVEAQRQQQSEELQKLEREISQMRASIQQAQGMIDHQIHDQEIKRQELQTMEQNLLSLRTATAELWGRVNLYQEILQPVQDSLDGLRQKLDAMGSVLAQMQESGDLQLQTIAQMRQTLHSLISDPQLTAS